MNTAHQNDSTARILVPDNMDAEMPIAKGSGIVAVSMDENMDVVYYEGNIYGASNLHDLETRIVVAAGRALQRAPTIALAALKKTAIQSRMREVGHVQMNAEGRMSVTITDKALYDQWEAKYSPSE